ncbi:hypothetical protein SAMN05216223_108235 [Actinacidiphila yanglinensis]|uniref:Uncharacterized protein n=1 Tax=Actinacidiphila yanglinensis TaxID=310779 RepID=A0A1H6CBK6_9ACTN|nr:hypothetical protein SAMN05216223_108235 [Actinacidiphila yanglinensis]
MIIATGSGCRKLGLAAEEQLSGRGVSWCATRDGFFFKDRDNAERYLAHLADAAGRGTQTGDEQHGAASDGALAPVG